MEELKIFKSHKAFGESLLKDNIQKHTISDKEFQLVELSMHRISR